MNHPFLRPRVLLPVLGLVALVNLPFLHAALRGDPEVKAAVPFEDRFERATIGDAFWSNGGNWRIASGQLYSPGVGNNPLWLKARLPLEARIEFDVRSDGPDGDVKWEAWGDGRNHASGYVFLFGAWHNRESRIAKLDEHAFTEAELRAQLSAVARPYPRRLAGLDWLVDAVSSPFTAWAARRDLERLDAGRYYGPRTPLVVKRADLKVERGRTYHMTVVRRGAVLRWDLDGKTVMELRDPAPLSGSGNDRFGFSSWQNDTWFDNLRIVPL